jgi:amino-acid N-acetyltransferase
MGAAPGTSRLTTARLSRHLLTALALSQRLVSCSYQVSGPEGTPGSVTVEGAGIGAANRDARVENRASSVENATASPDGHTPRAARRGPVVRKARAGDVPAMQALVAHFAARGDLLPRTLNEFYQQLRDFFVADLDGRVVGICALSLYWEDLAEVRSLAVQDVAAGKGLGAALVRACVAEASALGIRRVFALTYRAGFFARLGFREIDKRELPQKIWKDCFKCAKFANCDETALIRETTSEESRTESRDA